MEWCLQVLSCYLVCKVKSKDMQLAEMVCISAFSAILPFWLLIVASFRYFFHFIFCILLLTLKWLLILFCTIFILYLNQIIVTNFQIIHIAKVWVCCVNPWIYCKNMKFTYIILSIILVIVVWIGIIRVGTERLLIILVVILIG